MKEDLILKLKNNEFWNFNLLRNKKLQKTKRKHKYISNFKFKLRLKRSLAKKFRNVAKVRKF